MATADDIAEIRRDVADCREGVARVEERLTAHASLSEERAKTTAAALSEIRAAVNDRNAGEAERTKRLQVIAGVVGTLLTLVGAAYGVSTATGGPVAQEPPAPTEAGEAP